MISQDPFHCGGQCSDKQEAHSEVLRHPKAHIAKSARSRDTLLRRLHTVATNRIG